MSTTVEKTRPDDVLGNLNEDQQNMILDWCEESSFRDVLAKIAAPPPEGLGLTVHYTSLRRFYHKRFPERFLRERAATYEQWRTVADDLQGEDFCHFWVLAKESLEKHVFTHLQKEDFDRRELSTLMRLALRMEDQRLRWNFQFNETERIQIDSGRLRLEKEQSERKASLAQLRVTTAALDRELSRRKTPDPTGPRTVDPAPEHS